MIWRIWRPSDMSCPISIVMTLSLTNHQLLSTADHDSASWYGEPQMATTAGVSTSCIIWLCWWYSLYSTWFLCCREKLIVVVVVFVVVVEMSIIQWRSQDSALGAWSPSSSPFPPLPFPCPFLFPSPFPSSFLPLSLLFPSPPSP